MTEEVFIHKLNKSGSKDHQDSSLFCRSNWVEENLYFTVLEGSTAWTGQLEKDTFEALTVKSSGRLGDVNSLAREAFGGFNDRFAFAIDSEGKKLVWKKVSEKAKIRIAEIEVTMVNYQDTQQEMMEYLMDSNKNLKKENEAGKKGLENLSRDLNKAKAMLVKFEQGKNEIEQKLYGQFLPILNSKKKKIAELERGIIRSGKNENISVSDEGDQDVSEYGSNTDHDDDDVDDVVTKEDESAKGEKTKRKRSCNAEEAPPKLSKMELDDSLDILNDSLV